MKYCFVCKQYHSTACFGKSCGCFSIHKDDLIKLISEKDSVNKVLKYVAPLNGKEYGR